MYIKKTLLVIMSIFFASEYLSATGLQEVTKSLIEKKFAAVSKGLPERYSNNVVTSQEIEESKTRLFKMKQLTTDNIAEYLRNETPPAQYVSDLLYAANSPEYSFMFNMLMQINFKGTLLPNVLVNAANNSIYATAFKKLMDHPKFPPEDIAIALVISANYNVFNLSFDNILNNIKNPCLAYAIEFSSLEIIKSLDFTVAFNKIMTHEKVNDDFILFFLCDSFEKYEEGDEEIDKGWFKVLKHKKMSNDLVGKALKKEGPHQQSLRNMLIKCGRLKQK